MAVTVSTGVDTSTLTTNTNYLQPNGFRVSINRKYFPNLQFFAQSVMHPAMNATGPVMSVPRLTQGLPMTADSLEFAEVSMMIILDEDMTAYQELYGWLKSFVEREDATPTQLIDGHGPTSADITVSIMSSHNNVVKQIVYRDAIPSSLGDVAFEAATGDVQYIVFPANFRFSYFDLV